MAFGFAQLVGLPLACGPSIQPIHEGGVHFEHCYRLDLDPKIAPGHRHACWKQWLEVYSFGQSRDRLEYSQRRVRDLEAGDSNPPQLNLDEQEVRQTREFYMATPAPTSVHAPPPPVAPAETEPLAPGDTCVSSCRTARAACLTRCEEPAVDPATAAPPSSGPSPSPGAKPPTAPTPAPGAKPAPNAKPAPAPGAPPTAATAATAPTEAAEESAVSECDCEGDYKICGARCFE